MRIIKKVLGHTVVLDYKKVKDYPNGYTLYDVYKNNVFLYRTCLTDLQVLDIVLADYIVNEEEAFK